MKVESLIEVGQTRQPRANDTEGEKNKDVAAGQD